MVVRIDEISTKEDKPRFVSRKQRARLKSELAELAVPGRAAEQPAEEEPAVKRPKRDGGERDGDERDGAERDGAERYGAERGGTGRDGDDTAVAYRAQAAVAYPEWRVARERQLAAAHAEAPAPRPEQPRKWFEKSRDEMSARDWRIMRSDLQIACPALPELQPLLSWTELPSRALAARLGSGPYKQPTPVQRATIPLALAGRDVIGIAQTGSGKTLSFVVPLLLTGAPMPLVLAPTRELALQTAAVIAELAPPESARVVALVGGRDFAAQHDELTAAQAAPAVYVVATPGRLLDFTRQHLLDLARCTFLVLDEADRMIDLGFEEQIAEIMALLPRDRQTLMYTATWPRQIQALAAKFSRRDRAVKVEVGAARRSASIRQTAELLESQAHKLARLRDLVARARPPTIAFAATRAACDHVAAQLPGALALHGSMSQDRREATIAALRAGTAQCLVATDVASRGLDIPDVSLVVNYDMPADIDTYVHRIGRTGRAGRDGRAVSLCLDADRPLFRDLRRVIRESGSPVPQFLL